VGSRPQGFIQGPKATFQGRQGHPRPLPEGLGSSITWCTRRLRPAEPPGELSGQVRPIWAHLGASGPLAAIGPIPPLGTKDPGFDAAVGWTKSAKL